MLPHSLSVLLPQDCCAFWLVPVCIVVEATPKWNAWLPPHVFHIWCMTILGIPGWAPTDDTQPELWAKACLSCDPSHQVWIVRTSGKGNTLSYQRVSPLDAYVNKGLMYVNMTPKGETDGVLAFIAPVAQCRMALNGVHRDAGHQGRQQTLALAQERFWWPMMAEDCRAIVRGCPRCQAFEGEVPRAPLCLIRAYAPLELVHLDYTSIESMMELNKPPVVKNVLVMTDHFTRYALAVMTKDQTAKTVVKVFYERFIVIFRAPAKLLSDRGANFTPTLVEELCSAFGIQKCRTTAYHTQCNGQLERFNQTLFCMIGKLSCDKKAQWEEHLPELLQAYNSTWSAVTGYSPDYLMFGRCLCLPVDYYFPTVSAYKCSHRMPTYVTEAQRRFKEAYTEAHLQTNCKAKKQKRY